MLTFYIVYGLLAARSGVCSLFRDFLLQNDFQEIHTPKLIGGASEGGAARSRRPKALSSRQNGSKEKTGDIFIKILILRLILMLILFMFDLFPSLGLCFEASRSAA